jgi:hypothetical protein
VNLRYVLAYRRDKLEAWATFNIPRLLPQRLRYWVLMFEGTRNMKPFEEVPAVPYTTVLQRVGEKVDQPHRVGFPA